MSSCQLAEERDGETKIDNRNNSPARKGVRTKKMGVHPRDTQEGRPPVRCTFCQFKGSRK